jgi:thymidylate kinase
MIDTRLILIEGIPGTGKSTTAQWLAHEMVKRSIDSDWFMDEHRDHPVNVSARTTDEFVQNTLENWTNFADKQLLENSVVVLDGSLFSRCIHDLLPRDEPDDRIVAIMRKILHIARLLNPVIVLFTQTDLDKSFLHTLDQRGKVWSDSMVEAMENSAYAHNRQIGGVEGLTQFYEHFMRLTWRVLREEQVNRIEILDGQDDWPGTYQKILDFLVLPALEEVVPDLEFLKTFTGRYRDLAPGSIVPDPTCLIRLVEGTLTLFDFRYPQSELILVSPEVFEVQPLGYELAFERSERGTIRLFKVGGREPGIGIGDRTLLGRTYQRIGPVS